MKCQAIKFRDKKHNEKLKCCCEKSHKSKGKNHCDSRKHSDEEDLNVMVESAVTKESSAQTLVQGKCDNHHEYSYDEQTCSDFTWDFWWHSWYKVHSL